MVADWRVPLDQTSVKPLPEVCMDKTGVVQGVALASAEIAPSPAGLTDETT